MSIPTELRYSREHEWVRVDGSTARLGITDFAQESLGDVVFVQLPDVGLEIVAGASAPEIESTKSVSDVYVPVSGVVTSVNEALVDAPELVRFFISFLIRNNVYSDVPLNDIGFSCGMEVWPQILV